MAARRLCPPCRVGRRARRDGFLRPGARPRHRRGALTRQTNWRYRQAPETTGLLAMFASLGACPAVVLSAAKDLASQQGAWPQDDGDAREHLALSCHPERSEGSSKPGHFPIHNLWRRLAAGNRYQTEGKRTLLWRARLPICTPDRILRSAPTDQCEPLAG